MHRKGIIIMKFQKLVLNNIGPYNGFNQFEFNPEGQKNTILIGGKNGSGKTIFLTSVRLALYGPLAYGYKTETVEYLNKVSALLNKEAKENFYIQLEFVMDENLKKRNYKILRSWYVTKSLVKESVDVFKDENHLNDVQKDDFFEYLRTTFPPSLLEICFFDGEDLSKLSNDDLLSSYLEDLSAKLFNLELFSTLEKDIETYISQSNKSGKEKKLEIEKNQLKEKLKKLKQQLEYCLSTLKHLNIEFEETKIQYNKTKQDFTTHGGLIFEERQQLSREIIQIENERKQLQDQIKEFISKYLPFFISYPMLKQLVTQLDDEENYFMANLLREKISNLSLEQLLREIHIELEPKIIHQFKNKLTKELSTHKEVPIIHNASKTESHQVKSLFIEINQKKLSSFIEMIKENKEKFQVLCNLKQRLKDNETTTEFNEMIQVMDQANKKMIELQSQMDKWMADKEKLEQEIEEISRKYDKVNNELYNIYKVKSSFQESKKILMVSRKFRENQLRKKLKDVEFFSTKMFKSLLRKDSFFSRIMIDHRTFSITLLDEHHQEINKSSLSAGEKELLVLSIIWGMIKASKKQLPFVLDTLLGRLDNEHKHSVITKLVPNFGHEVIVLSTDSEIDEKLYKDLIPYISNEYTLHYDISNKKTFIETHFFNYGRERTVQ